jgi:hypothetical protein
METQIQPSDHAATKIDEGGFFKDWAKANEGTTMIFPKSVIDNTAGQVSDMGIAVMTTRSGGATGSGILGTYEFLALTDMVEPPTLTDLIICDAAGKTYSCAVSATGR